MARSCRTRGKLQWMGVARRFPLLSLPFSAHRQECLCHRKRGVVMRFLSRIMLLALSALRRNVLRSALTTLGIVIGIAAVIAMMEIGQGSSGAIQKTIQSMGANNLLVQPGTASSGGVSFGSGTIVTLTPQDAETISRECPAVDAVA